LKSCVQVIFLVKLNTVVLFVVEIVTVLSSACETSKITTSLFTAFGTSHLDFCDSVLAGVPKLTIAPLKRVLNASVRLVMGIGQCNQVTQLFKNSWLRILYRMT